MNLPDLTGSICRPVFWISAAVLVATFVLRPDGYEGISVCTFKNATGVDCWGCGMTRGVTSITHLRFPQAWAYHPFAYLFWPLMITFALGVFPPIGRRIEQLARTYRNRVNLTLWIAGTLFVVYGLVRMFVPSLAT